MTKKINENELNIRNNSFRLNELRDKIAALNNKVQHLGIFLTLKRNISKNMILAKTKLLYLKEEISLYKEMDLDGIIQMNEIKSLIFQFESIISTKN